MESVSGAVYSCGVWGVLCESVCVFLVSSVCMCVHVCARVVSLKEVVQAWPDVCLALTSPLPPLLLPPASSSHSQAQTLAEREAALAAAEQTMRQDAEVLEGRKRQTQEIVIQAALQEGQQARSRRRGACAVCRIRVSALPALPACIACMHCLPALVAFVPRPTATAARRVAVWLVQWLRRHMSPHGCLATSSPRPAQHRTDLCALLPVLPLPPNLYCRTPQRMMGTTLTLEMRQMRRGSTRPGGTGS